MEGTRLKLGPGSSVGASVGLKRPRSVVDPGSGQLISHKDELLQGHRTSSASWSFYKELLLVSIAKYHPFLERLLKLLLFYSVLFIQQTMI